MAVVTSAWSTIVNQNWASPTWSTDDPSYKLDVQLTNWINAINDTSVIEKIFDPGQATSRDTSAKVYWLLRARSDGDTSSDYGIYFFGRNGGTSLQDSDSGTYYQRSASSENLGGGTFQRNASSSLSNISFTSPRSHFTAYEAAGTLPWFAYSTVLSDGNGVTHLLARVSTAGMTTGSYYPASGLGKWVYIADSSALQSGYIYTPQSRINTPYIGIPSSSWSRNIVAPSPSPGYGSNYFFSMPAMYAPNHFIGQASQDILVTTSSSGGWGDTTTFNGITYTCLRAHTGSSSPVTWVRTS
jgi:hypothetical protein